MLGLNGSLSIATQSLLAQNGALATTNNNISNANTPGYSRQVVTLTSQATIENGASIDGGVSLGGFHSIRDSVLQWSLRQQTSTQASAESMANALAGVQTGFTVTNSDIGSSLSKLFASISSLSTNPSDLATRQNVLSSASNLTMAFHQTSAMLTKSQQQANSQVSEAVTQINQLSRQIASFDSQLNTLKGGGQDGGSTMDQRDELVLQLAKITGIEHISTGDGETLTIGSGRPLVVASESLPLQTTASSDGSVHILDANGNDITAELSTGSLGGALQIRDTALTGLQSSLDALAYDVSRAINSAQTSGFDLNGASGQNLFTVPASHAGAASMVSVAISDPVLLAASSDGASGSSGNVPHLLAVQSSLLASGQSPTDAYTSLVFQVGNIASNAKAQSSAAQLSVQQLADQRSSFSGVSIDEESVNLIRYQHAYQAAAKVISTIDSLYSVVLNMGSGGGGF